MGFAAQTKAATSRMERAMKAAAQLSVERVVAKAETVRGEGGRMRVDFGFLRSSGGAAFDAMPRGPTDNPDKKTFSADEKVSGMPLPVALAKWDFKQSLNYGWTAGYARARESKDKFLFGAAQLWPEIVAEAVREVKSAL